MAGEQGLIATTEQLGRLEAAKTYLFDLDDTIALYDHDYTGETMARVLIRHAADIGDEVAERTARSLTSLTHYGHGQTEVLKEFLGDKHRHGDYWNEFLAEFNAGLTPEHIKFDPDTIRFIGQLANDGREVGIISNNSVDGGTSVVGLLAERTGIDLRERAVYLAHVEGRKPEPEALASYLEQTQTEVVPELAVYLGNTTTDVMFAENTGMLPVVIDYEDLFGNTEYCERHRPIAAKAVIARSFAQIGNHLFVPR